MSDTRKPASGRRPPRPRRQANAKSRSGAAKAEPAATAPVAATEDAPAPAARLAVVPLHVRWRDLDAFNHVNNSSYLTFLEEARLQWLRQVPGEWFNAHAMPVMAAVELHYRKPIAWPAEVDVLLSCERLGTTSMTIGNRIAARDDHACVYADGNVVMVWVDPATGAPVPLPDALRKACVA